MGDVIDIKSKTECQHEFIKVKENPDIDSYYSRSLSDHSYSIECKCCNKRWDEYQDKIYKVTSTRKTEWIR